MALVMTVALFIASCNSKKSESQTDVADSIVVSSGQTSQQANAEVQKEKIPDMTFADVEGVYDDGEQKSRFVLNADGTATWGVIGIV